MADIDVEQHEGGQKTWIWMAIAIVSVLALMFWLASQDADTGPVVMEEDGATADTVVDEDASGTETVELAALGATPDQYMGRTLRIENAQVAATLGPRAFWANISGQNPFLVVANEDAGNTGSIASGNELELRGTVAEVTEEIVDQWIADGAVNEGARDEATFATHYLAADRIR